MATLLSASELANVLKVSTKWMYKQLNKGSIAGSRKIGGVWFIDFEIFTETFKKPSIQPKVEAGSKNRHSLL